MMVKVIDGYWSLWQYTNSGITEAQEWERAVAFMVCLWASWSLLLAIVENKMLDQFGLSV